jgi:PPOX class probable F420-dependent enzyme
MINTTPAIDLLLAKPLHAVLAVNRPGRSPQLSVVWFEWDGETFRFSTRRSRAKFKHLMRDPQVAVLIDDPDTNTYVSAYGTAWVQETGHTELAGRLRLRYLPNEPAGAGVTEDDRVVIALTPDRIFGGF